MFDTEFVRRVLGGGGKTDANAFAEAFQELQHACAPEMNWADSHSQQPAPLGRAACAAAAGGQFSVQLEWLARAAAAAGVPEAAAVMAALPSGTAPVMLLPTPAPAVGGQAAGPPPASVSGSGQARQAGSTHYTHCTHLHSTQPHQPLACMHLAKCRCQSCI